MTIADSTVKSIQTHGRYVPESLLGKGSYGSVFDACASITRSGSSDQSHYKAQEGGELLVEKVTPSVATRRGNRCCCAD
jgi:hypothetical protein